MVKTAKASGMTIDQLAATIQYVSLPPGQQAWVKTYLDHFIATGLLDARRATKAIYQCSNEKNYRKRQCRVLRSKNIQAALQAYWNFGQTDRDRAILELDKQIAAAAPGSTAAAQLLAQRNHLKFGTPGLSGNKRAGLSEHTSARVRRTGERPPSPRGRPPGLA